MTLPGVDVDLPLHAARCQTFGRAHVVANRRTVPGPSATAARPEEEVDAGALRAAAAANRAASRAALVSVVILPPFRVTPRGASEGSSKISQPILPMWHSGLPSYAVTSLANSPKGKSHDRGHPPHFSLPPRAVSPVDVAMETRGRKRIKRSADVDAATPGCRGCADLKTELAELKTELCELRAVCEANARTAEANARTLSELPQQLSRHLSGDFGVLLGALIRELPEVFEAEVLSKLDCKDHFSLALVNKACRDSIYKVEPIANMRKLDVTKQYPFTKRLDGTPFPDRDLRQMIAAEEGRLDVLKWLFEKGCPMDHTLCASRAAYTAHVHILQWMKDNGMIGEWHGYHMFSAASFGHLEVVKWLRANGCPWDEDACRRAAEHKHWDTLQYLVDNKCPGWEEAAIQYAEHLTITPGDDE